MVDQNVLLLTMHRVILILRKCLQTSPTDMGAQKRWVTHTPFEKGKPVERPGRKATGLRADLPRQLLSAGLPKEDEARTSKVRPDIQRGVPQPARAGPKRTPSSTETRQCTRALPGLAISSAF
jgi:hypothetical protein